MKCTTCNSLGLINGKDVCTVCQGTGTDGTPEVKVEKPAVEKPTAKKVTHKKK